MSARGCSRLLSAATCAIGLVLLVPQDLAVGSERLRYGEVIAAEQATFEVRDGSGSRRGATIGAVAGYALADGQDRWLGAAVGGIVGGAIGSGPGKKKGWLLAVLLDSGEEVAVQVVGTKDAFSPGNKVRLFTMDDGQVHVRKR